MTADAKKFTQRGVRYLEGGPGRSGWLPTQESDDHLYARPYLKLLMMGEPRAWARAIPTASGKAVTPKVVRDAESAWGDLASVAMGPRSPWDGPVGLCLHAIWGDDAGTLLKRQGLKQHQKRWAHFPGVPDVSNVLKLVEDGVSGIIYTDDRRITSAMAHQWIAPRGEPSRVSATFAFYLPDATLSGPPTWVL